MASKMHSILVGLLCLFGSGVFAQQGESGYNPQDSSVVPSKRLPQHTEFMANNYAFPAKPRNQWELGVKVGAFSIAGDVRSVFPGIGAGLHVRKAIGYVFSLRGELGFGTTKGLNYTKSSSYISNPAWAPYISGGVPTQPVIYNYKSNIYDLSLQGVITLNNIRFHRAKTSYNLYGFGGFGGMIFDTKINALNGNALYDFSSIPAGTYTDRKKLKKAVRDLLDGSYETPGEIDQLKPKLFGKSFRPLFVIGLGMQFKLNKKISLSLEDRFNVPLKSDLLDGQQYQSNSNTQPAMTRDFDTYNFFSAGLNIALGAKSVEPLWWINPLDYAYNEINKPSHMKLPKPILDDADGDGVTDQFDNEPNTPAGSPVDSHGVSRDTDGDGVPDARDKELITPTQCQPVDADGVGKCPPPDCCKVIDSLMQYGIRGRCNIGDLPSVTFKGRSVSLSKDAQAMMAGVASKIRDNSECKIAVIGYCASSKSEQQLSWDRVNAVINYLVEKEGVSADRFIFKYGQEGGDCNTVDLRDGTQEEGPTTVPAPHPNLRRR
jgi:outer membrane protein OmpA-like peptidoglycan-associated protein